MSIADAVAIIVGLLSAALIVGLIAHRVRFPYSVALVISGLFVAFVRPHSAAITFKPQYLFLVLPALVFEAAWTLDLGVLRRVSGIIAFLAFPGVVITGFIIAGAAVGFGHLGWGVALLLGAILSATDPVAVIALFRTMRMPSRLSAIIEGEAISNDAVAIVAYQLLLPLALGINTNHNGFLVLGRFLFSAVGGVAIGLLAAMVLALLLRKTEESALQIIATIIAAYGSYVGAEAVQASGIFATAAASIALKAFEFFPTSEAAASDVEHFWSVIAFISNALIFLLTGLTLRLDRMLHEPILLVAVLLATLLTRAFVAYAVLPVFSGMKVWAWRHVVAISGLRGGVALALALSLPPQIPERASLVDVVFGVVFLTLVLQGTPLSAILGRLGVCSPTTAIVKESPRVEVVGADL